MRFVKEKITSIFVNVLNRVCWINLQILSLHPTVTACKKQILLCKSLKVKIFTPKANTTHAVKKNYEKYIHKSFCSCTGYTFFMNNLYFLSIQLTQLSRLKIKNLENKILN